MHNKNNKKKIEIRFMMYKTVTRIDNKKIQKIKKIKDYNVIDGQLNIFKNNQDLIQCGLQKFKN